MKNLIPELFLAIEFFVYFCEVTSSSLYHGEGSSRTPSYRHGVAQNTIIINYRDRYIEVVRKTLDGVSLPVRCTILNHPDYPEPRGIPTIMNKAKENFATRPLFGDDRIRYCVVYATEHGEVLGVTVPPTDLAAKPDRYNDVHSSPMNYGGGSSRPPSYPPDDEENTIIIPSRNRHIAVVRKTFGGISIPMQCSLLYEPGLPKPRGIPTIKNKGNENFATHPLFGDDNIKYCVVYVTEHGEILGVKVPPTEQKSRPELFDGNPSLLNPNATTFYITHSGFHFAVTHVPHKAFLPTRVTLFPINKENYTPYYIEKYDVQAMIMKFGGIRFFAIFKTRDQRPPVQILVCLSANFHFEEIPSVILGHLSEQWVNQLRAFKPRQN